MDASGYIPLTYGAFPDIRIYDPKSDSQYELDNSTIENVVDGTILLVERSKKSTKYECENPGGNSVLPLSSNEPSRTSDDTIVDVHSISSRVPCGYNSIPSLQGILADSADGNDQTRMESEMYNSNLHDQYEENQPHTNEPRGSSTSSNLLSYRVQSSNEPRATSLDPSPQIDEQISKSCGSIDYPLNKSTFNLHCQILNDTINGIDGIASQVGALHSNTGRLMLAEDFNETLLLSRMNMCLP